jgi:uncharacterized phage-associated protein
MGICALKIQSGMDDNAKMRGGLSTMTIKYTAFDIADYFLFKAQEKGQELLSNLKLQKLLYYSQGLHLALFGSPLFSEKIEAWTYGPVVVDVYHLYKDCEAGGIAAKEGYSSKRIDEKTKEFLNEIYEAFGQFSALRLMEISHKDQCWIDAAPGNEITWDAMRTDLKKYLKDA